MDEPIRKENDMSILIKGMDMPKDCSYCILANEHINGLCEKKYYCRLEADFEHCPLIDVPDSVIEIGAKFILLGDKVNRIIEAEE